MRVSWWEVRVELGDSGIYWAKAKGVGRLVGLGGEGRWCVGVWAIEVERVSGCG